MTLRGHILLAVTPLLLLLLCLGGAGAALLLQLGQRSDAILRENYDSVRAMTGLNEALERIDSSYQFALAGKERDAREAHRANWVLYREQLGVEERNVTIFPEEPRLVAELQDLTIRRQCHPDTQIIAQVQRCALLRTCAGERRSIANPAVRPRDPSAQYCGRSRPSGPAGR